MLFARALTAATGHPVVVTNTGVPGLTTSQLLVNIHSQASLRAAVAAADIVTITIGHNDTPWNSLHDHCDGVHAFFGPYRDRAVEPLLRAMPGEGGSCVPVAPPVDRLDGAIAAGRASDADRHHHGLQPR